jgi:hypothetical protein
MAAAFPLEPPKQDTASASKSDKLLEAQIRINDIYPNPHGVNPED